MTGIITQKGDAQNQERKIASYATHELRAPLTSIRSALELMQMRIENQLGAEDRMMLEMALRNSKRLDSLINDIMDFSKIRAGWMKMKLEAIHPRALLKEAMGSLQAWAVSKGVRLVLIDSGEPLPWINADRKRTVQTLINLLSNAIKFTPAGGTVELSAALGRHNHAGAVLFRVKDSGPGIPTADLERIFHCFEQSALGTKSSQGTGLGLTLAKAMVEIQGGRIWAASWEGLGASFFFTLPILSGDAPEPVAPDAKAVSFRLLLDKLYRTLNTTVTALFA